MATGEPMDFSKALREISNGKPQFIKFSIFGSVGTSIDFSIS